MKSNEPQKIDDQAWYYENTGSLEFIVYPFNGEGKPRHFKITASRLLKSIERMGKLKSNQSPL